MSPAKREILREDITVLEVPRTGIDPLDLFLHDDDRRPDELAGSISQILSASVPLPTAEEYEIADISGVMEKEVEVSFGLSILKSILGKFGKETEVEGAFSKAHGMKFQFIDSVVRQIELIALSEFLGDARVIASDPQVLLWLNDDKFRVVTKALCSSSIVLEATDSVGAGIEIALPASDIVGARGKLERSSATSYRASATSGLLMTFGFQAMRLNYEGNRRQVTNRPFSRFESIAGPQDVPDGSQVEMLLEAASAAHAFEVVADEELNGSSIQEIVDLVDPERFDFSLAGATGMTEGG